MRDGALCIDIRGLNDVDVDAERSIVRVGGGALLGELDAATQEHGLAVPAGQVSHTGVGGLTLGGGIGWLMRRHGLTIDSLLAAEVVLADGRLVRASEEDHPDLFWALRGGGGDFGAVTAFEFRAHRVGPTILGGMLVYGWAQARDALRACRELMAGAPDELTLFATLITAPPHDPFPDALRGRPALAVGVAWSGDLAEGARALAPLRNRSAPAADLVGPMPYVALQSMLDVTAPHGWRFYDRMHYLDEVGDEFVDALLAAFLRAPAPETHVVTGWMGGAIDRVAPGATAFGHRGARALTWIIGCSGEEPVDEVADWVRETWEATRPYAAGGVYVNALDGERPVRDAYADEVWDRLLAVKRRYDPEGAFEGNGIRPLEPFPHGERGRLGAAARAELGEHASDVVLGRLGRDHEPLGDRGVREARGDQAGGPRARGGQLVALAADRAAAGHAQVAQHGRGAVGLAASTQRLEGRERRPRRADGERRAAGGLDARQLEPRPGRVVREPERGEPRDGVLELRRCRRGPSGEQRRLGPQILAVGRLGQRPQAAGRRSRRVVVAGRELQLGAQREQARPLVAVEQRPRQRVLAALEVQADQRRARLRLVVEAVEQPLGLLDAALPQAQLGEHGQRQRPPAALVPARAALERLDEHRALPAPTRRRAGAPGRRCHGTTTGPA